MFGTAGRLADVIAKYIIKNDPPINLLTKPKVITLW